MTTDYTGNGPLRGKKSGIALLFRRALFFGIMAALLLATGAGRTANAADQQKTFASPEDARAAFVSAMRAGDHGALRAIFGPEAEDLIVSGDSVADRARKERFVKAYEEKNALAPAGDDMVLTVGEKDWPFPIPLVKEEGRWRFDTGAGREEILNRRIGENELATMETLHAIVDAQREFAEKDHDGDGLFEYAGTFGSDPGMKNGLYWETGEGEEPSPLGALVARARTAGYEKTDATNAAEGPLPYYGYYFKLLDRQGEHAPGGAYSYVVNGKQIGGFAVLAYPASHGNSGVMTFVTNYAGIVYQKDLGEDTATVAKAIEAFDPDPSWKKTEGLEEAF